MTLVNRSRPERAGEPEAIYVVVGEGLAEGFPEFPAGESANVAVYGPPYETLVSPEFLINTRDYPADPLKLAGSALRGKNQASGPDVAFYARYPDALVSCLVKGGGSPVAHLEKREGRYALPAEDATRLAGLIDEKFNPHHRRLLPLRAAIGSRLPDVVSATQNSDPVEQEIPLDKTVALLDERVREYLADRREAVEDAAEPLGNFNKARQPGVFLGNAYLLTSVVPREGQRVAERVAQVVERGKGRLAAVASGGRKSGRKTSPGK